MSAIPFQHIDWSAIEIVEHKGETGISLWQTVDLDGLRIRMVEYSAGYTADHWCQKGHIVLCVEGEFISEFENGEQVKLVKGDTYVVSDEMSSHKSVTQHGAKLFIIDGNFLKS